MECCFSGRPCSDALGDIPLVVHSKLKVYHLCQPSLGSADQQPPKVDGHAYAEGGLQDSTSTLCPTETLQNHRAFLLFLQERQSPGALQPAACGKRLCNLARQHELGTAEPHQESKLCLKKPRAGVWGVTQAGSSHPGLLLDQMVGKGLPAIQGHSPPLLDGISKLRQGRGGALTGTASLAVCIVEISSWKPGLQQHEPFIQGGHGDSGQGPPMENELYLQSLLSFQMWALSCPIGNLLSLDHQLRVRRLWRR